MENNEIGHKDGMEVLILAMAISLLLTLLPVRSRSRDSIAAPPAIRRSITMGSGSPEGESRKASRDALRLERLLNESGSASNSFATRVHTETISFEGKTFVIAEHDGILLIREDS